MADKKHTPLPWKTSYNKINGVFDSNGTIVTETDYRGHIGEANRKKVASANAEFIVRACNSHYELLTLLKEFESVAYACKEYLGKTHENNTLIMLYIDRLERIKAAIAKAEGK